MENALHKFQVELSAAARYIIFASYSFLHLQWLCIFINKYVNKEIIYK